MSFGFLHHVHTVYKKKKLHLFVSRKSRGYNPKPRAMPQVWNNIRPSETIKIKLLSLLVINNVSDSNSVAM